MCEAVAIFYVTSVFHCDIKLENFIVTDGWSTLVFQSERGSILDSDGSDGATLPALDLMFDEDEDKEEQQ